MSTMAELDVKKLNATEAEKEIEITEPEQRARLEKLFESRSS